eukprot:TRINITY_DN1818_c0_g1_i2.p1 TRINITY_DN1818_c0_g1~~TRINITY_DN1818_c0_g1_i2.p1  ORF type:complete len:456 (+),score=136.20 TRINITY_DN1818_c0_g1_i2:122-1489(+)
MGCGASSASHNVSSSMSKPTGTASSSAEQKVVRRIISAALIPVESENSFTNMASWFDKVPEAPVDPILGLNAAFKADPAAHKLNLGVGAYRTEDGKPWVLSSVKRAEEIILNSGKYNKEYLPIDGLPEFNVASARLMFGEQLYEANAARIVTVQSLSGTGGLKIAADFIHKFMPHATVYISDPTWANHKSIMSLAGVPWKAYRYIDRATNGLDFGGMVADLDAAPDGSVVLLHSCAHNPTGVDPSTDQWATLADLVHRKGHFVLFDNAYQGFASGDLDRDAYSVRLFLQRGFQFIVTQSFAKNFGLYAERIGACNVITGNEREANCVRSQLKLISRATFSNPPIHGALIVSIVLSNAELTALWKSELKSMADRIIRMRQLLLDALVANSTPGNWQHIVNQIGMFSFTGLSPTQVEQLTKRHSVYLTADGRISMAGLSAATCPVLAAAIKDVITNP